MQVEGVGKFGTESKLDYWTPGVVLLSDPGHFLYTMENYDKENLTQELINKLKVYVENPNFQPAKVWISIASSFAEFVLNYPYRTLESVTCTF